MPSTAGGLSLQSRNGSILVTSRSKDTAARLVGSQKNTTYLDVMEDSQALRLFRNKLESVANEEGAAGLLCASDKVPLAITQAATYINRQGRITASGYLEKLREDSRKK